MELKPYRKYPPTAPKPRPIALLLVGALLLVVVVVAWASPARADSYGTNAREAAQMKALIYQYFGHGWKGDMMVRCARRESGLNPRAANYGDSNGGSYGLLQLNGVHRWRGESLARFRARMWNPRTHLRAAKRLFDSSGVSPWGSC